MSVGTDGYLYFTVNQLSFGAGFVFGAQQKPYAVFRAKLPNNGTKVLLT